MKGQVICMLLFCVVWLQPVRGRTMVATMHQAAQPELKCFARVAGLEIHFGHCSGDESYQEAARSISPCRNQDCRRSLSSCKSWMDSLACKACLVAQIQLSPSRWDLHSQSMQPAGSRGTTRKLKPEALDSHGSTGILWSWTPCKMS